MIARINRLPNAQAGFIIAVAGVATFWTGLGNPFGGGDDQVQIVINVPVHSIGNIVRFFQGGTVYNGQGLAPLSGVYYRPLMTTIYSLIYTIFGPNPIPFHVVQQLLCISSAVILYLIFRRCSFQPVLALLLSLVFLVHPIDSQVVFAIPCMQDALFFFFGILALWLLLRFHSVQSLIPVAVCIFLSLLSNETGIVFGVVALVYLFWFDRRRLYGFIGIMLLPGVVWLTLRFNAVGLIGNPNLAPIDGLSLAGRLFTAPSIVLLYLTKLVWPLHLATSYYWVHPTFSFQYFVLPLLIDLAVVAAVVYVGVAVRRKGSQTQHRTFWFFVIWSAIGILVHLQLIPLDVTANETWFYFPMAGVLGMIGMAITTFAPSIHVDSRKVIAFGSILIVLLGVSTALRGAVWGNAAELNAQDIENSPDDFAAESSTAALDLESGDFNEAKVYALKSVVLFPSGFNYYILGEAYANLGDYSAAANAYDTALKYQNYVFIYEHRAALTLVYGDPATNKQWLLHAINVYPQDSVPWAYLAYLDYRQNDRANARYEISQAHLYAPSDQAISSIYDAMMNGLPINVTFKP